MASLPPTPFNLHGGCFCNAITYTISVPTLESRPLVPNAPKRPLGAQTETDKRLPMIALDHCNSCRRISGSILECWFICPQSWMQFCLLPLNAKNATSGVLTSDDKTEDCIFPVTQDVLTPGKELEEKTYLKGFISSEGAHRTFCGRCGTHLTFHWTGDDDDWVLENWGPHFDVAVGTFDKDSVEMEGMRPGRHSWWAEGIKWVQEMVES